MSGPRAVLGMPGQTTSTDTQAGVSNVSGVRRGDAGALSLLARETPGCKHGQAVDTKGEIEGVVGGPVEHQAERGKNGKKWYCGTCLIGWPCLEAHRMVIERIRLSNPSTDEAEISECLLWPGYVAGSSPSVSPRHGYGRVRITRDGARKWMPAHRFVWMTAHGPIPDGLCVLHRCDVRPCVRLEHLYLGTTADNNRDRDAKGRGLHSRKTACPRGHPYDYVTKQGYRQCRTCHRETERRRLQRLHGLIKQTQIIGRMK